ncbi:hypothetical protein YQE_04733, partial [Dendroctonus ponderosae]
MAMKAVTRCILRCVLLSPENSPAAIAWHNISKQPKSTDFNQRHRSRSRNFPKHRDESLKFGFNVWSGMVGSKILEPFIFEGHLNGTRCLQFLWNHLDFMLDDLDLETWRNVQWFQHDGALPYNFFQVRNHLDLTFLGTWIGRNGPILWPPRSPDLSPLDLFLWGAVKNTVYKHKYSYLNALKEAVREFI